MYVNNLIIRANKFSYVRNDAANAFQMRRFACCSKWDTDSIHLHTAFGAQWCHFIEHLRKTMDTLFTPTWDCHLVFYVDFWHTFLQCPQFNLEWKSIRCTTFLLSYWKCRIMWNTAFDGRPFVCKYCTYVVVVFDVYHPKKRRKSFIRVCVCVCALGCSTFG